MGGSFYFGFREGQKKPQIITIKGVGNLEDGKISAVDFGLFWETWNTIKEKYIYSNKLSDQDLVYGAVNGLVNSLGDPNTNFFPPDEAKKFSEDISGEFSGIGAEIGIRNGNLVIVAPLKDSPAEKIGIKAGDKILKIDGKNAPLTTDEGVKLIRGKKGTAIVLTILRNNWNTPKDFSIVRDTIRIPTVEWKILEGNIAHINLYNFYEKAPLAFYDALLKIVPQNPKGIILDLRDNPGGYLEAAINLAGWFFEPGTVVVTEEFSAEKKNILKSTGSGFLKNTPVVVLINGGSASASEILAGALRDNRKIKLIGEISFGKGTVQELMKLRGDSEVKVTVAHWLMPNGGLIEKNGIKPDYEVKLTDKDIEAEKDPQLDKAIEVIKKEFKI